MDKSTLVIILAIIMVIWTYSSQTLNYIRQPKGERKIQEYVSANIIAILLLASQ